MSKFVSITKLSSQAENVWFMLHGIFVVYKPPAEHPAQTLGTLKHHLCRDLNKLEARPPSKHVWIEGETNKRMTVAEGPSYADDPLLTGPRYQPDDVRLTWANSMGTDTSGVLVCGIRKGYSTIRQIREAQPVRLYKVKGILGHATDNFFTTGKVVEKSTFKHIRREQIDKICAAMQSSHQKKMFELCGVHIQSQAAYELAVQGPIRAADIKVPMIYSIKCIFYEPPELALEIVCTNEDEMYFKGMIHELGMQLRSTATCSQIQCVRYGLFTVEQALLKKHWNLECIAHNMAECRNLLKENEFITKPTGPILKEYSTMKQIESTNKPLLTGA